MANTQRAKAKTDTAPKATKTYKFASLKKEAERKRAESDPMPDYPPFVMDDVVPPIVITVPDTLERQITITDFIGQWKSGNWDMGNSRYLLAALCGDQFGRVWMLIKDDPDPGTMIELINAMFDHFSGALPTEAADLPGGSEDSLN